MSEENKNAIDAFNSLVNAIVTEARMARRIVNDGCCIGCPRSVPKYDSVEIGGIQEAMKDAKAVFASNVSLLEENIERAVWENVLIEAVTEELKSNQYGGDPYDNDTNAYNAAMSEIIKRIPDFIKGLAI